MDFSAKSAEKIFAVFFLHFSSTEFVQFSHDPQNGTNMFLPKKDLQAVSANPERGMRVEELERLLALETGGDELGVHLFLL